MLVGVRTRLSRSFEIDYRLFPQIFYQVKLTPFLVADIARKFNMLKWPLADQVCLRPALEYTLGNRVERRHVGLMT